MSTSGSRKSIAEERTMRKTVWGLSALFVTVTLAGCGGGPENLADGLADTDGVRADQDVAVSSQGLTLPLPNFCDSFTDPFSEAQIKHSTTALCLNETVTNPDTLDYDVTMSFPDLAGSSTACGTEHARVRIIGQDASGGATIFDDKASAKIVGAKCLAKMTLPYLHLFGYTAVRFNVTPDPIAVNLRTTGTVTPFVP